MRTYVPATGPFWIPTTLIFILFFSTSLAATFTEAATKSTYTYDFTKLSAAAACIYIYGSAMPAMTWAACKHWKIGIGMIEVFTIYGYSWSVWIPVAVTQGCK